MQVEYLRSFTVLDDMFVNMCFKACGLDHICVYICEEQRVVGSVGKDISEFVPIEKPGLG